MVESNRNNLETLQGKLSRVKGECEVARRSQEAIKTEYENYKVALLYLTFMQIGVNDVVFAVHINFVLFLSTCIVSIIIFCWEKKCNPYKISKT